MRRKKTTTNLLAMLLIAAMAIGGLAGCTRELTEQQSAAVVALQNAVTYYENEKTLIHWEELVAIAAANRADGIGINWNALTLPDTPEAPILATPETPAVDSGGSQPEGQPDDQAAGQPQNDRVAASDPGESGEELQEPVPFQAVDVSAYPGAIITSILKGEDYQALTASLISAQNPETGAFDPVYIAQHIWAMITLDSATGTDGYDYDKAAAWLLTFQRPDGGFAYAQDSAASDMDLTGIASVALAPYYEKHKKADEMKALVSYYTEQQTASGGYANGDGENPGTISMAIWGLTALDRELPKTKEGGLSPLEALLAYQNEDGSFRTSLDGEHKADAYSSRVATIALCDVINDVNTYVLLAEDAESYRIENITGPAITLSVVYPEISGLAAIDEPFVVEEGTNAVDAIVLFGKVTETPVTVAGRNESRKIQGIDGVEEKSAGETSGWIYKINGQLPVSEEARPVLREGDALSWIFVPDVNNPDAPAAPESDGETIIQ